MSSVLPFSHGIDQSRHIIHVPSQEVDEYVKQHSDLNEIVFMDGNKCRAFIDIDGNLPQETSEEDFKTTHQMILDVLSDLDLGTPFSITTSSRYNNIDWRTKEIKHKLSYVLVFINICGSKYAVSDWTRKDIAPRIKDALEVIIPFYIKGVDKEIPSTNLLDYDNSVYRQNGKMRCIHSTKPGENRPRILHSHHTILDTMITYVPLTCEELHEPEIAVSTYTPEPEKTNELGGNDHLRKVVMGLETHRANERKDWITVGMALFNEDEEISVWEDFSKQSPKYCYGECHRIWRGFRKGSITQRTLWKMLKEDNPILFNELWKANRTKENAYRKLLEGGHRTLAEHFINCKPDDYLYHDKSGWWNLLSNKTWTHTEKKYPATLPLMISRILFQEMDELGSIIRKRIQEEVREDEKGDSWNAQLLKKTVELRKKLLQSGFIKGIIEFCQSLYAERTLLRLEEHHVDDIYKLMDSNPMLFAFEDSLYDFTEVDGVATGKRPILPSDYVTITCGWPYPVYHQEIKETLEDTLKTIWSYKSEEVDGEVITYGDNGETYEYTMKMLATSLCGVRWMEAFYIMTGSGRNGKGLLFDLLRNVLGNYYYTAPVQILTTKLTDSTSANPEANNLKGKRLVCCSEPEISEKLQEGVVKSYTGGDEITGRALYGEPIKFKPQMALYLQCNNIPSFNGITRGGVLRNVVIPFPFEFVAEPKIAREKLGNPDIKNRLCKSDEWRDAMWFVLLDRFETIRGKALDAVSKPFLVKERTNAYIQENNAVGAWWNQKYTPDPKSWILTKEAFQAFITETGFIMSEKTFNEALRFNLLESKKITSGVNKDRMGLKGWKIQINMNIEEQKS